MRFNTSRRFHRRLEVPQDLSGRNLAQRHQSLARRHQTGEGLVQIGERRLVFPNAQPGGSSSERDRVMQRARQDLLTRDGIDQLCKTPSHLETGFARLARRPAGAQFGIERIEGVAAAPGPTDISGVERAGLFEVSGEEWFEVARVRDGVFRQGFKSKGVRRPTDREGRIRKVQQAQTGLG